MGWLVTIHVLAAVLGIGPTYFGHILLRKNQSREQLLDSLALFGRLNYFPKIGGTLAVVSGILLVALTGWEFSDLWIVASLGVYVIIQVMVVGMLGRILSRLAQSLSAVSEREMVVQADSSVLLAQANRVYYTVSVLGLVLILLMVLKPM
ncbi:DUF2269 family protein [Paenibacillus koleovorans]|uniref:DUF2269 family protein n=1 Tax=Paenibacillus koleovorans TaxID=121608 RepID=UPI000FD6C914|nr:DUF2269 family protein [Paenibacillus koleovorans]